MPSEPATQSTATTKRKRLSTQPRSSTGSGTAGLFLCLFGLPFLGVGVFIVLLGAGVVETDPEDVNAPMWVISAVGAVFALAGLMVLVQGVLAVARSARAARVKRERPDEPWLADYPWNEQKSEDSPIRGVVRHLMMGAFMVLFLTPFNWWAFVEGGGCIVTAIVCLFDVILLAIIGHALYLLMRYLKYGASYVRFKRFPFRLGGAFDVDWGSPRGIGRYNQITFTLRCVEQRKVTKGRGKNRRTTIECNQVWADTFEVAGPGEHFRGDEVPVTFLLPDDQSPTEFRRSNPRYWELVIHADTPGVDFEATYLVPIYAAE